MSKSYDLTFDPNEQSNSDLSFDYAAELNELNADKKKLKRKVYIRRIFILILHFVVITFIVIAIVFRIIYMFIIGGFALVISFSCIICCDYDVDEEEILGIINLRISRIHDYL